VCGRIISHFVKYLAGISDADIAKIIEQQQELQALAMAL
jgi:hypothetical protein